MFVAIPNRTRPGIRWATPLLLLACVGVFLWLQTMEPGLRAHWLTDWGALDGNPPTLHWAEWRDALLDGSMLRPFTALFLHADWPHLLGNLAFLLIFALPAERVLGGGWLLGLFLGGGALANFGAQLLAGTPGLSVIGASGAISAVIGAYLALFPRAQLGLVLPLGLFLEFVKVPASLLIGVWVLLQMGFAYIGPSFGETAWVAHVGGFLLGAAFALLLRQRIARRLRHRGA
ncbi:MAG: rhomboid family intramembrane serine protease [Pseudoxanthomonas suwonensis]|nr:rhomboid family intramembrane serine protease [Pseudoxanthomonas suwonensis]